MDVRLYPSAKQIIPTANIVTSPTTSDLIETIRGDATKKAITIANLLATPPALTKLTFSETAYTATGAIASTVSFVALNHATVACAMTIAAPAAGRFLIIYQKDAGTAGHTVTLTSGTYNGSNTIATFDEYGECLVLLGVSATRFLIVSNIGSVGLSGP
jgi:hypothetical protein